ncbi:MAG: type II toxin-antitoxin system HicA family toxin [Armatimonadetes bacterium]|nr:type II toxin-antitoxin system HicA family toxin [Armatimonadota bacterium]
MSKVLSLNYPEIIRALEPAGWVGIQQRGSRIRLHKFVDGEVMKVTVPAHKPVKRSTLAHILKQARLDIDRFLELL